MAEVQNSPCSAKKKKKINKMKYYTYFFSLFSCMFTKCCLPKGSFSFLKVYHASSAKIPHNLRGGVKAML